MAQPLQPLHQVEAAAVAQVGHILLEGQAEHQRRAGLAPRRSWSVSAIQAPMPSLISRPARITCGSWPSLLREMAEIIGIDADAVAADQARLEAEEIPLGPRRREHVPHRHADLREDLRDLVHEGDVDVALGVLDRLGRLGRLDRRRAEHAAAGDRAVDVRELLDDLLVLAGDDLGDPVDACARGRRD